MLRTKSFLWGWLGEDARLTILILLIPTLPLAAAVSLAGPRWHGLAGGLFVAGGACLLLVTLWRTRMGAAQAIAWTRQGLMPWLLALLGWNILSMLAAPEKRTAALGLLSLGAGITVYAAAALQTQSRRLRMILDAVIGVMLLASLLTIFAALALGGSHALTTTNNHLVRSGQSHLARFRSEVTMASVTQTGSAIPGGPFGSPQRLTAFLVLMLPLLLPVAFSPARLLRRLMAAGAILAGCAALLCANAFSFAWPGILAGAVTLGLLSLRYLPQWCEKYREIRISKAAQRAKSFSQRHRPRSARLESGSRGQKLARVREIAATIPTGALLTTVVVLLALGWFIVHARPVSLPSNAPVPIVLPTAQVLNFYLQPAAKTGLPGLLLWTGFLAAFFITGLRTLRHLPDSSLRQRMLIGALAGVAAQTIDAVTNPAWQAGQSQFFLWLALGLAQACTQE